MLAHLRTEAYPVYAEHRYPPHGAADAGELSYERNLERIEAAKRGLEPRALATAQRGDFR